MENKPILTISRGYEQMLDLYYSFLIGEIDSVPTHLTPLGIESAMIVEELKQLNTLGILSIDSQPGLEEISYIPNLRHNVVTYQREYLCCYMPNRLAEHYREEIGFTDFLMFWYEILELGNGKHQIPVTGTKTLAGETIEMYTSIPINTYENYKDFGNIVAYLGLDLDDTDYKSLVYVQFIDPVWSRTGVLMKKLVDIGQFFYVSRAVGSSNVSM